MGPSTHKHNNKYLQNFHRFLFLELPQFKNSKALQQINDKIMKNVKTHLLLFLLWGVVVWGFKMDFKARNFQKIML